MVASVTQDGRAGAPREAGQIQDRAGQGSTRSFVLCGTEIMAVAKNYLGNLSSDSKQDSEFDKAMLLNL